MFIYNFTKYIEWPSSYQNGNFVIGVFGDSPVIENLEKMASVKKVGAQPIQVVKFNSVPEISKCHILFVPAGKSKELEEILIKTGNQATLVITEKPGLAKKGSAINFVLVNGRWKFEINNSVTASSNLKVSSELLKMAIVI